MSQVKPVPSFGTSCLGPKYYSTSSCSSCPSCDTVQSSASTCTALASAFCLLIQMNKGANSWKGLTVEKYTITLPASDIFMDSNITHINT